MEEAMKLASRQVGPRCAPGFGGCGFGYGGRGAGGLVFEVDLLALDLGREFSSTDKIVGEWGAEKGRFGR